MAFIYKVTNLKNNKAYIGKTNYSIQHRWQQHIYSSYNNKDSKEYNFLLHKAIRKYGKENFIIEEIEEISENEVFDREKYWIAFYKSCILFPNGFGYNMTFGGEGSPKIDYPEIFFMWESGFGSIEISKILGCHRTTIKNILENNDNYTKEEDKNRNIGKKVYQYDSNGILLKEYQSISAAARELGVNPSTINKCCNKVKQSCKGYFWSFSPTDTFKKSVLSTWQKYMIVQKDKDGKIIKIFPSFAAAGRAMNKKQTKYIKECCDGIRKEMYGYIWEYYKGEIK